MKDCVSIRHWGFFKEEDISTRLNRMKQEIIEDLTDDLELRKLYNEDEQAFKQALKKA